MKAQKHDETAKSRFNNGILEIVFTKRVDKGKRQANKQHEQFFFIQVLE
jgi:HSP20 family molecular chaperone IbpA